METDAFNEVFHEHERDVEYEDFQSDVSDFIQEQVARFRQLNDPDDDETDDLFDPADPIESMIKIVEDMNDEIMAIFTGNDFDMDEVDGCIDILLDEIREKCQDVIAN